MSGPGADRPRLESPRRQTTAETMHVGFLWDASLFDYRGTLGNPYGGLLVEALQKHGLTFERLEYRSAPVGDRDAAAVGAVWLWRNRGPRAAVAFSLDGGLLCREPGPRGLVAAAAIQPAGRLRAAARIPHRLDTPQPAAARATSPRGGRRESFCAGAAGARHHLPLRIRAPRLPPTLLAADATFTSSRTAASWRRTRTKSRGPRHANGSGFQRTHSSSWPSAISVDTRGIKTCAWRSGACRAMTYGC